MQYERAVAPSEHHVQLFDSSKSLVDTVSAFLLAGFRRGEPMLVVATPGHLELLTRRFASEGLDVHGAIAANRLVMLDAAQALNKIMRHDEPSPIAFDEIVGTMVARLADGKRVCIYGEMVDLLAARGNYKGAYQLEELWNLMGRRESYTLFCGYASGHFGNPKTATALGAICAAHDHVHRQPADLLAEYLLEQKDVKMARAISSRS
ncbi:MAG: MEDS domain-containing protein [Acidobacteriota bacterium]